VRLQEVEAYLISESSFLHILHQAQEASQPSLLSKGVNDSRMQCFFFKILHAKTIVIMALYRVICIRNRRTNTNSVTGTRKSEISSSAIQIPGNGCC
jgi:hypothetical protein